MAFAHIAERGTNNEKTSDNSLATTLTGTVAVGRLLVCSFAFDSASSTDGSVSLISVADTQLNSWIRGREWQFTTSGGVDSGAHAGVFYTVITTQLTTSDSVTVTTSTNVTAKAMRLTEFSFSGSVEIESDGAGSSTTTNNISLTLSGANAGLWIGAGASESAVTTGTLDADYTHPGDVRTTGGSDATNIRLRMGYRIASLSSDNFSNSTGATSTDHAGVLVAFREVAVAGGWGQILAGRRNRSIVVH